MEDEQAQKAVLDKAKMDEQAERYEDMVADMKIVTQHKKKLGSEERNLLSVAYKNVVGSRRASWRAITSLLHRCDAEQGAKDEQNEHKKEIIKSYRKTIGDELNKICKDVQVRFSFTMGHLL